MDEVSAKSLSLTKQLEWPRMMYSTRGGVTLKIVEAFSHTQIRGFRSISFFDPALRYIWEASSKEKVWLRNSFSKKIAKLAILTEREMTIGLLYCDDGITGYRTLKINSDGHGSPWPHLQHTSYLSSSVFASGKSSAKPTSLSFKAVLLQGRLWDR